MTTERFQKDWMNGSLLTHELSFLRQCLLRRYACVPIIVPTLPTKISAPPCPSLAPTTLVYLEVWPVWVDYLSRPKLQRRAPISYFTSKCLHLRSSLTTTLCNATYYVYGQRELSPRSPVLLSRLASTRCRSDQRVSYIDLKFPLLMVGPQLISKLSHMRVIFYVAACKAGHAILSNRDSHYLDCASACYPLSSIDRPCQ
ncbi:hypothetical protein F5Y19DRAFT_293101 [Xylariaceae sp. FL1651]|nr:hypothetical protein F5Y19DRAFT_293101 [Xylariaceae sp. FL1651]